ncbi:hypothetical protein ABZ172_07060 [Streptomyces sp. NPDC006296]|uniref:hypothetical protein n=1 Tax=Streptomyces sp. NPDC006296 TaxID=3156746 RepID=UPI0033A2D838
MGERAAARPPLENIRQPCSPRAHSAVRLWRPQSDEAVQRIQRDPFRRLASGQPLDDLVPCLSRFG